MASDEENMQQNSVKEDVEPKVALHKSDYVCTFVIATDVEKIKAALNIECDEKVKAAMSIEPVEKQHESGHVMVSPAMFEENAGLAVLTKRTSTCWDFWCAESCFYFLTSSCHLLPLSPHPSCRLHSLHQQLLSQ